MLLLLALPCTPLCLNFGLTWTISKINSRIGERTILLQMSFLAIAKTFHADEDPTQDGINILLVQWFVDAIHAFPTH